MEEFDIVVIGAGVVGLSIASSLPEGNNLLIERHESFGKETSSRNSEVIHAGIYYPKDSLKARLFVRGNELVYKICKEYKIDHKKIGKIIIAIDEEEQDDLKALYEKGIENKVKGLEIIDKAEIKKIEPSIKASLGIFSPETGILDSHNFMKHFENKAKEQGVVCAYGCEVQGIDKIKDGYKIKLKDADGAVYDISAKKVINSAGLNSDKIAQMVGINDYKLHFCKGEYFRASGGKGRYLKHLVYPCPSKISLGIHTVLDLGGGLKFGPNAFYVDSIDYDINPEHSKEMYDSVSKYLNFIDENELTPDTSGIRPKLQAPGEDVKDFVIQNEAQRGLEGFINLIGIESPGLTAAPAIAEYVVKECL